MTHLTDAEFWRYEGFLILVILVAGISLLFDH